MDISNLKQKELPHIPEEIKRSIQSSNITQTPFDRKNEILIDSSLQTEAGYNRFSDGSYLVSMYGLFLISRFWLGRTMNPVLRKLMINDAMAQGMAEHCAVEYRNLAEILPALYKAYK